MKVLNLDGLSYYNENLLNKVETMIDEKVSASNGATFATATATSSRSDNAGYYTKIATIDISNGAWSTCTGLFNVTDSENSLFNGQFIFYFRSQSDISNTEVTLHWLSLTNYTYIKSIVAVKVSDGIFDLYYKPPIAYLTTKFTLIDCVGEKKITLYSNQDYIESVEVDYTSELINIASTASTLNGLTSTVYELNYCDGVTSNIQNQLDNKSDSSHTHDYLPLSGGTLTGNVLSTSSDTTERHFQVNNSLHNGHLCTSVNGNFGLYSNTNTKWLVKCDTSGNVILNGSADTVDGYHADSFAKLNGAQFTGAVTIQSDELNGAYNGLLIGDDCYIGDCNISNTIGLMGKSDNNIAYVKFGKNGGSLGYNGSNLVYDGSAVVTESTGTAKSASDSDKVDGYHASNFCFTGYAQSTDMNAMTTSGTYRINSGNTNAPSGADWGQILVVHGGGDTIAQLIFDYSQGRCWLRTGNPSDCGGSGAWTEWRQLYTSQNITYGTSALTAGSSSLATGSFYYQYE